MGSICDRRYLGFYRSSLEPDAFSTIRPWPTKRLSSGNRKKIGIVQRHATLGR